MRSKATLPLFSSASHTGSVFFFAFATIKGSPAISLWVRERIESTFHKRLVRPKLEVTLTHHLRGTSQGVPSKHILKKHFKRIRWVDI
ncbi:hypothetical protein N7537_005408 [Penicillium hordei]|uniref:Uncharacterized protein n=1 Tax=Penicillium hordei TaxID=40994 RepID=A0AAD6E6U9_9EURO|nr:uncharacterized protein N7537_005408 [Penicillium hordei]KAJ5602452.1 hypothetical protein N7537_005408 [Penicillium hordei]